MQKEQGARAFFLGCCFAFFLAALSAVSGEKTFPQPQMLKAKPGDWVLFAIAGGDSQQKMILDRIEGEGEGAVFHIRYDYMNGDKVTGGIEVAMTYDDIMADARPEEGEEVQISTGAYQFKDRILPIEISIYKQDGGETMTMYYSPDVPLTGLVKAQSSMIDVPSFEIIDFGHGEVE